VPSEIGGAVLAEFVELAERRVSANEREVTILGSREQNSDRSHALAVKAKGERVALARGRAEVEAAEGRGDRTKYGIVGARKNGDEPRLFERRWGPLRAGRQWGALAARTYFAQLIQESSGDGFCGCVGLCLSLREDIASVVETTLEPVRAVKDLDKIEVFLLGFEELDAESADAAESS
jgi:hypothetical protein